MGNIGALEASLSTNEVFVTVAIGAVVVGLVLEYGPEFLHSAKARRFGLTSVGAILVVLGVAGELALHVRSSRIVSEIRELQRQIDASQRETIAKITEQSAEATERAAKANERAAELRLALEREVAARRPRTISDSQRASIVADLSNAPKGKLYVIASFFDAESVQFARQVVSVLKQAGFEVSEMPQKPNKPIGYDTPGAWMWVHEANDVQAPHAKPIQDAFQKAGLYFDGQAHPDLLDAGEVLIAISSHP